MLLPSASDPRHYAQKRSRKDVKLSSLHQDGPVVLVFFAAAGVQSATDILGVDQGTSANQGIRAWNSSDQPGQHREFEGKRHEELHSVFDSLGCRCGLRRRLSGLASASMTKR